MGHFFAVEGPIPMVDDGVYDGVDPLSAPDIAEGRGRIPLPSISSPASPLVTRNLFVLMPAGRARSRASTSCRSPRRRRKVGRGPVTVETGRGVLGHGMERMSLHS